MFHGVIPVHGGAHRPWLEERPRLVVQEYTEMTRVYPRVSSQRILTDISLLHPCATATVQAHSRQHRRQLFRRSTIQ